MMMVLHIVMVFSLLIGFGQVNAGWEICFDFFKINTHRKLFKLRDTGASVQAALNLRYH